MLVRDAYARVPWSGTQLPPPPVGWLPPPIPGDPARYAYWTQTNSRPWACPSWANGFPLALYPGGGLVATPDPAAGVMRVQVWWADAPALHLTRIEVDGPRAPVRTAYPLTITAPTRRNYCANPSVEAGLNGYVPGTGNPTLTRVEDPVAPAGAAVLRASIAAAGSCQVTVPTATIPVSNAARTGTIGFALRTSQKSTAGSAAVTYLNAAGGGLGTVTTALNASDLTMSLNQFYRHVAATTIPAGAVTATLKLTCANLGAGALMDLDAITYEIAATDGSAFDGDTLGGTWLGTADLSASTLAPVTTVLDGDCPLDTLVRYQLAYQSIAGGWMVSDPPVLLPSNGRTWVTHPGNPGAPLRVDLQVVPVLEHGIDQGTFWPIGSTKAVTVSAPRRAATGELAINTYSFAERDALRALLADGAPLLFRAPAEYGWGGGSWLALGAVTEDRGGRKAWQDYTLLRAPFAEVDTPPPMTIET